MIIILIIIWYITGLLSFIYWWTQDWDLTYSTLPVALFAAIIGPLAFFVGYVIHGKSKPSKTIFKKRL